MSAHLFGVGDNEVVPQADFKATQNENGGWQATQSFVGKKGSIDNPLVRAKFKPGTRCTDIDPDLPLTFQFMRLVSIREVGDRDGGWTVYSAEFQGFYSSTEGTTPGSEEEFPTYSMRGVLEEAPFSEHPKWSLLSASEKYTLGLLINGQAQLNVTDGTIGIHDEKDGLFKMWTEITGESTLADDALEFAKRIASGITTYKRSVIEWTKHWEGSVPLTAAQIDSIGRIATPEGNPPIPNAGNPDWMLIGASQEQRGSGSGIRITKELTYLLSDSNGHDSFLYVP